MELSGSETKLSLMRAFAGECQSNARYTMAAQKAASKNLYVIQEVFKFTAQEELAHARVFYDLLSELSGQKLTVNGDYPVMVNDDPAVLLSDAQKHDIRLFMRNLQRLPAKKALQILGQSFVR